MNTLTVLRDLDRISAYLLYVSLFYLSVSAYKRTKQKGFVFWVFAALGFLLNAPLPFHTGRSAPAGHGNTAAYFEAAHSVALGCNILMLIGTVLIIQGYVALFSARDAAGTNRIANKSPSAAPAGDDSVENRPSGS